MSLSAYVVKSMALEMKDDSHPREAILKHAKVYSVAVVCSFFVSQLAFLSACFLALMHRYVRLSVAWSVDLLTSVFLFLYTSLLTPVFVWLSDCLYIWLSVSVFLHNCFRHLNVLVFCLSLWLSGSIPLSVCLSVSVGLIGLFLCPCYSCLPTCLTTWCLSVCLPDCLVSDCMYVCM